MHKSSFEDLIRLLKLIGGKFIIVEDGQPRAVLMSYEEFQDLALPYYAGKAASDLQKTEEVNRRITSAQLLDLREEVITDLPPEIKIEPLD